MVGNVTKKPEFDLLRAVADTIMLLVEALSSLEPQAVNYLSFHVEKYNISKDELDQGRLAATKSSPVMEAIEACLEDGKLSLESMGQVMPRLLSVIRKGVGFPSKAASARVCMLLTELYPNQTMIYSQQLMQALSGAVQDPSSALLRKVMALALAKVSSLASQSAVEKELEYWNAHMTKSINEFVEEELSPAFGGLIQFVKQSDNITDFSDIEVGTLEKISVNFSTHWKQAITNINSRVTTSFGNTKTSQGVLQVLLRQLLFFYSKFIGVLEKRFDRNGRIPFRTDPVGLENVKFEIKRFLPNIQ